MKVLFLLDVLEECREGNSFYFMHNDTDTLIKDALESHSGYVKIGVDIQSHSSVDSETYALLGGTAEHNDLLMEFFDDHSNWVNLGMDFKAFFKQEKAIILNSDAMNYTVWAPIS